MHRCPSEPGNGDALQEISESTGACIREPKGTGAGDSSDGIFSQQDQIRDGCEQRSGRKIRRRSTADHGRNPHATRGRAENRKRCVRDGVRNHERRRGGHPRAAAVQPIGTNEESGTQEDRTGLDEGDSPRPLDQVFSPTDLARPARLRRSKAEMRHLQSGDFVQFKRQNRLANNRRAAC